MCVNFMCAMKIYISNEDLTPKWLNRISGALALIPIESTPRGWIGVQANLGQMMRNLKLIVNTLYVIKSESEFSMKGFGTTPLDSSRLRVEELQ